MEEYLMQILVATIPALITGILAYVTANKKAKSEMETVEIQANKELERIEKDNQAKFEDLERQRKHDLEKLKEERKNDLIYYKGQLEAQAGYDETMKQNRMVSDMTSKYISDLYEKSNGDLQKMMEEVENIGGNSQADKVRQFAKKKKGR